MTLEERLNVDLLRDKLYDVPTRDFAGWAVEEADGLLLVATTDTGPVSVTMSGDDDPALIAEACRILVEETDAPADLLVETIRDAADGGEGA